MQRGREGFLEGFILPFKASEISSSNSLTAFPTAYKPFELEGPAFIVFQQNNSLPDGGGKVALGRNDDTVTKG